MIQASLIRFFFTLMELQGGWDELQVGGDANKIGTRKQVGSIINSGEGVENFPEKEPTKITKNARK